MMLKGNDLAVAAASWGLGYCLRILGSRVGLTPHATPAFREFVAPMGFSMIMVLLTFSRFGLYVPKRTKSLTQELGDVARAVTAAWAMTYVVTILMSQVMPSRLMMVSVLVSWLLLAVVNRIVARETLRWFRRRGWNQRTAAIVGTGRLAQKLCHALRRNIWTGITPQYFISDSTKDSTLLGLDVVAGPIDTLDNIVSRRPTDIVFVALAGQQHDLTTRALDRLATADTDVQVVPDLLSFHFLRYDVAQLDDIPIITMTHSPQHGWNSLLKRGCDILISATAIVVTALPMLVIALAVKLTSKGPVLYRQVRAGLGAQAFTIIKFRTMAPGAEDRTGPVWASPNDRRVTALGRILRRTSLDELPQLLNVLVGHMSLVGPRPERPEMIERLRHQIPRYMLRHHVKAGLTGWAQVHGLRGQTSLRKRIQYDLYYIENWSFLLDVQILLMTVLRGFINPSAY